MTTTAEAYLDAVVGDLARLITGTFNLVEFILGVIYFLGQQLAVGLKLGADLTWSIAVQTWDFLKILGLAMWDLGGVVVEAFLLIYYAIFMIFEAFYAVSTDLWLFTIHVLLTIYQHLYDAQNALVSGASGAFSIVPNHISQALVFIGDRAMTFFYSITFVLYDFIAQLVLAPLNVLLLLTAIIVRICDIPFYLFETFDNFPLPGKVGLGIVAVCFILYWKINFYTVPRLVWKVVKSFFASIFTLILIVRNFKGIVKHALNRDNEGDVDNSGNSTKAICVICQVETVTFITKPCRHVCLCKDCVLKLVETDNRCPVCRTQVEKFEKVYIPL